MMTIVYNIYALKNQNHLEVLECAGLLYIEIHDPKNGAWCLMIISSNLSKSQEGFDRVVM